MYWSNVRPMILISLAYGCIPIWAQFGSTYWFDVDTTLVFSAKWSFVGSRYWFDVDTTLVFSAKWSFVGSTYWFDVDTTLVQILQMIYVGTFDVYATYMYMYYIVIGNTWLYVKDRPRRCVSNNILV